VDEVFFMRLAENEDVIKENQNTFAKERM